MEYYIFYLVIAVVRVVFVVAFCLKLRYELQMFQQNSYRNERFVKWLKTNLFNKIRLFELGAFVLLITPLNKYPYTLLVAALMFLFSGIKLSRRKSKVKFNFTSRAKRLYFITLAIFVIINSIYFVFINDYYLPGLYASAALCQVFSFALLMLTNIILKPVEKAINNSYINDAKRILAKNPNLLIIGITGSYGKTSTKHFLETVLSQKYNVLMTPGSYNTTMGVVRTIREYLNATHEIFICEMGAKQVGDIKEICDIVHPKIGILTSVAEQHLDTFKNIENVRKTKFELIDSLPQDGLAILNGDYEIIKNTPVKVNHVYYSADNKNLDYSSDNISYSQQGTSFDVVKNNITGDSFKTGLLGSYNLSNILACIACAERAGLSSQQIAYGVYKLMPVEHRMEIKVNGVGLIIIDDAFNSNPKGAQMALDVLSGFPNKRFVITPGIVELADKQDFYNFKLGNHMAVSCDYAVLVGRKQTQAIYNGLIDKNFPEDKIYIASGLNDAAAHVFAMAQKGDSVLFENDLPDTYY